MTNVFVVIGGWKWDGEDGDSVRVFTHRELAEDYAASLTEDINASGLARYDFTKILECPLWTIVEVK